jgi:hypothetical protein
LAQKTGKPLNMKRATRRRRFGAALIIIALGATRRKIAPQLMIHRRLAATTLVSQGDAWRTGARTITCTSTEYRVGLSEGMVDTKRKTPAEAGGREHIQLESGTLS